MHNTLTQTMPLKAKDVNLSSRSRKSTIENQIPSRLSQLKEQPSKSSYEAKDQYTRIGLKGNNVIQHNQRAITPLVGRNGKNLVNVFRPPTAEQVLKVELAQQRRNTNVTPSKNTDATSRKDTVSEANKKLGLPYRQITPLSHVNQFTSTLVSQMSPKSTFMNNTLA